MGKNYFDLPNYKSGLLFSRDGDAPVSPPAREWSDFMLRIKSGVVTPALIILL